MKLWGRCLVAAALAIVTLSLPLAAFADTSTFNAIFFQPATGRNPYLMLQSTQTLHQLQFDAGAYFSYGYHPLQILQGNQRAAGVIDQLIVADIVGAIGAMEWLEFGFDFPVVLLESFSDPQNVPQLPMQNFMTFGDLRVEAKARVLDSYRMPVGLAFIPFMTAPTGKSANYVGDSGITGGIKISLDGRVIPNLFLTMNVGYQVGKKVQIRNVTFQNLFLYGAGISGTFAKGVGVAAEINGQAAFNKFFTDRDMNPAEAMASVNWDIGKTGVTVQAGGGTCLVCGVKGSRIRAVVGAKYRYNPPKYQELDEADMAAAQSRLGKGLSIEELKELKTICPPNPTDYQEGINDARCPKYYDLSELANLVLRCPAKEEYNPRYHDPACPKVFNLRDSFSQSDIMNIYELSAAEMGMLCPPNPTDYNPQLHDLGCPKYYDLKEVAMLSMRCPNNPENYVQGRDDPACPKFYELKDAYPEQAWMAIAQLSDKERQLYGTEGIYGGEIQTLRPIYFDFAKSDIRPDMIPTLDAVVNFINQTPWIGRIRVGGNADAIGSSQANEQLGFRRAESVISYMRSRGLRPDAQLNPVSYGANRPVAPNTTEEGRAMNRRVIFIVTGWYSPTSPPPKGTRAKAVETGAPPVEEEGEEEEIRSTPPPKRWQ